MAIYIKDILKFLETCYQFPKEDIYTIIQVQDKKKDKLRPAVLIQTTDEQRCIKVCFNISGLNSECSMTFKDKALQELAEKERFNFLSMGINLVWVCNAYEINTAKRDELVMRIENRIRYKIFSYAVVCKPALILNPNLE